MSSRYKVTSYKRYEIVPVNFNAEDKAMLGHCKMILENDCEKIALNPDKFDKLITALRTAVDNDDILDKEAISYSNIFDAFRPIRYHHYWKEIGFKSTKQIKQTTARLLHFFSQRMFCRI